MRDLISDSSKIEPGLRDQVQQEISQRQQAEEALRKSEQRFRHVISSISDHIYVTEITEDGRYLNRYLSLPC